MAFSAFFLFSLCLSLICIGRKWLGRHLFPLFSLLPSFFSPSPSLTSWWCKLPASSLNCLINSGLCTAVYHWSHCVCVCTRTIHILVGTLRESGGWRSLNRLALMTLLWLIARAWSRCTMAITQQQNKERKKERSFTFVSKGGVSCLQDLFRLITAQLFLILLNIVILGRDIKKDLLLFRFFCVCEAQIYFSTFGLCEYLSLLCFSSLLLLLLLPSPRFLKWRLSVTPFPPKSRAAVTFSPQPPQKTHVLCLPALLYPLKRGVTTKTQHCLAIARYIYWAANIAWLDRIVRVLSFVAFSLNGP